MDRASPVPAGARAVPDPRRDQNRRQRPWHGAGGHLRARALQHAHLAGARHHPQKSPHRLLHRHFRVARGCRGTAHAGLRLPAVPAARHFRAAHRGELHHPGPGRSLRRQKHGPARHRGRAGHGAGLHHVPDFPRFHPRSVRGWNAVRDAGDVGGVQALLCYGRGSGRVSLPPVDPCCHESDQPLAAKRKGREEPENISSGCASCGGCSGGKS